MRTAFLSACLLLLFSCGTNRAVYRSADFEQKAAHHQTIAILPAQLLQTGHRPKDVLEEDVKAANENWGYAFQESLQTFILRQTNRNRKGQMVSFQSTQKTNGLLKAKGLNIETVYGKQPEEIAQLLGVDAVIMTTLHHNKNLSDAAAYGLAAARTVVNIFSKSATVAPGINASEVSINCSLYDAADSQLLWKTYRDGGAHLPSNVEGLIEHYSNWIAKKLPYRS